MITMMNEMKISPVEKNINDKPCKIVNMSHVKTGEMILKMFYLHSILIYPRVRDIAINDAKTMNKKL